ncbi:hypothetical protein PFICI_04036 [Pestalotiopsis fici W106-1]|uniref:Tyrosinase copper-binding domain-containing protein n=1 Tax=Pestalotiopsis fici (strain W106-1 / CGMCC3.15140) TaxID=1229662 RepID=W3XL66_PESFW|nr:uncharacterized protein PFICI_04036 [Pestalotiopsis fici W106-1]ETS86011.1 hypothetical protein PFICI_04036 [Pestalotiopsis fici W106-1]
MYFTSAAATLLLGASFATAAPCSKQRTFYNGTCTAETVTIRKEWRNLAESEQASYLEAVNCLMELPANTSLSGVTNRFSDLQATHRDKTNATVNGVFVGDIIHSVGQFLPWHRWYIYAHEVMLRDQCNYTGPLPWWDEAKDADTGNAFSSPMWSADAFGGNGTGSDLCVVDGAFANHTEHIGPGLANTDYCLDRSWDNEWAVESANSTSVKNCTRHNDYETFWQCMVAEKSTHKGIHTAVGGLMGDKDTSPGDPIFFLHHNYVDRIWWQWQTANPDSRMYDMSGTTFNTTYLTVEGIDAPDVATASLDYVINIADILPDVIIGDVMNVQNGLLCYDYDY